jgi:hypothetical protein
VIGGDTHQVAGAEQRKYFADKAVQLGKQTGKANRIVAVAVQHVEIF